MNFITPLLFVFYLQVMPPPPPTMHGGGDYWAGNTNQDSGGDAVNYSWGNGDLISAIFGNDGGSFTYFDFGCFCFRTIDFETVGYNGALSIIEAIDQGYITALTGTEWNTLLAFSGGNTRVRGCQVARAKGRPSANSAIDNYCGNVPEAPIPKELFFLSILSFLFIYCYHNREEFSNLTLFKKSS
jgi:hypothetical protein